MKKNVASQVIGAQMITAADGTAFTGTVTVVVTIDGGTQSASGGTGPTHEGNGFHSYLPTQAETNGDHVAFTFTGTGAIPTTVQVYTTFPQTGDNFARLGAPAGASVSADVAAVKVDTAAILVDTGTSGVVVASLAANSITAAALAADAGAEIADAVLDEALSGHVTAGTLGKAITDIETDATAILADTGTDGVVVAAGSKTGYTLTATTGLGNQTADITGNLSGSVGSVTGAVGSVTGAVGSVTGNVGGNVTGSVGSLATQAKADVNAEADTAISDAALATAAALATVDTVVDNLNLGIIYGAAATGTLSTTQATTDLTGYADDQLIGRHITVTSGAAEGEQSDITDYASTGGLLTFTALTVAMGNGDTFKIT